MKEKDKGGACETKAIDIRNWAEERRLRQPLTRVNVMENPKHLHDYLKTSMHGLWTGRRSVSFTSTDHVT